MIFATSLPQVRDTVAIARREGSRYVEGLVIGKSIKLALLASLLWHGALCSGADDAASASVTVTVTEHDILPILLRRCTTCHGGTYTEGELDLRSREAILRGGESGPAIVLGDADGSRLIEKIVTDEMPPNDSRGRAGIEVMTAEELVALRAWVDGGAPETPSVSENEIEVKGREKSEHWAFQTPLKSDVPVVTQGDLVGNEVDAFLLAKLEDEGMSFSPKADALTLLRRASFLLTGLPPTVEETRAFFAAAKTDPRAFEKLIDRLLDSPRYGERWGRVWLDVAGYADSEGKRHADMIRNHAWRYRDYVIRSLNDDKPYDVFLTEQLAGDELAEWSADAGELDELVYNNLVATGFLRMAPDGTTANPVNRPEDRLEVIGDELRVLSEGVMGLTMECARCHDHKYDPLSQKDYYQLAAVFKGAYDEYDWMTPQGFNNQWKKSQQRLLALALPDEKREWQDAVAKVDAQIEPLRKQVAALDPKSDSGKEEKKKLEKEIKELEGKKPKQPMIRALWDRGRPSNTYVLDRGDHMQPSSLVEPHVPMVIRGEADEFSVEAPWPGAEGSGRRLAFARWLTKDDHPLTARVIVNRVWAQHFGAGIVESLDNFGTIGTPPSHPELLDWLAVGLVENGWSLKWLQRTIVGSTVWQQRSRVDQALAERDPHNRLFSRMPLRRMDAEEVRDTVLLLSGRLDETPFGKPDDVDVRGDGMVTARFKDDDTRLRRSIYIRHRRKEMPTILETFDKPAMNPNCVERSQSTIVTQPLHLLNNEMIHHLAGDFAKRVIDEASGDRAGQIEHAWRMALNRPPTRVEVDASLEALDVLAAEWEESLAEEGAGESPDERAFADFCHTLINSAEFLYLD